MMCQPSGPESQSDKLLGIAVSKHSSTDQQFLNPPEDFCESSVGNSKNCVAVGLGIVCDPSGTLRE